MLLELLEELLEQVFEHTDIESLQNLAVCSRAYSELCRPYMWRNLKIQLIDIWDGKQDIEVEVEHLLNKIECYFKHTESLRLTDDSCIVAYLITQIYEPKRKPVALVKIISKILTQCRNLCVLHTALTLLPTSVFEGLNLKLREVTLSLNAVTDECVEALCNNAKHHLRSLTINGTTMEKLKRIESHYYLINMSYFGRITPSGFAHVVRLPHLAVLCLSSCDGVDDECVKLISTMTSLKHLSFIQCNKVTKSGLTSLSAMLQLERLTFKECNWMTSEQKIDIENQLSHVKHLNIVPVGL